MTPEAQVQVHIDYWTPILRLQDWTIDVVFKRYWSMDANTAGQCDHNLSLKKATILLLDPQDLNDTEDLEEIVVHELLHLHTATFHSAEVKSLHGLRRIGMENMVDQLAQALVNLRRTSELSYLTGKKDAINEIIDLLNPCKTPVVPGTIKRGKRGTKQ